MTAAQYGRSRVLEPGKEEKFSSSERGMNLRQILALFIAQGTDQQIIHESVNRSGVPTFLNDLPPDCTLNILENLEHWATSFPVRVGSETIIDLVESVHAKRDCRVKPSSPSRENQKHVGYN